MQPEHLHSDMFWGEILAAYLNNLLWGPLLWAHAWGDCPRCQKRSSHCLVSSYVVPTRPVSQQRAEYCLQWIWTRIYLIGETFNLLTVKSLWQQWIKHSCCYLCVWKGPLRRQFLSGIASKWSGRHKIWIISLFSRNTVVKSYPLTERQSSCPLVPWQRQSVTGLPWALRKHTVFLLLNFNYLLSVVLHILSDFSDMNTFISFCLSFILAVLKGSLFNYKYTYKMSCNCFQFIIQFCGPFDAEI